MEDQLIVRMCHPSELRVSTINCVLMYFSGLPSSYSAREMTHAASDAQRASHGFYLMLELDIRR